MPPKKAEEAPKKKKAEPPKELCGCGVNTYQAPPKGKKLPPPIVHNPGCSFQRSNCNRYPHLPKCAVCTEGCSYCCQTNPWCPYCSEHKCKFMYKRDVLGWKMGGSTVASVSAAPNTGAVLATTPPGSAAPKK